MKPITDQSISIFYRQLAHFTDKILLESHLFFSKEIEKFRIYLVQEGIDENVDINEYYVEFIRIGILMNKYASFTLTQSKFENTDSFIAHNNQVELPDYIENFKNYFLSRLQDKNQENPNIFLYKIFSALLSWLKYTDEYKSEITKLEKWAYYFTSFEIETSPRIISLAMSFAKYFEEQSNMSLGQFTNDLANLLNIETYENSPSQFFSGSEAECNLNILSAELLNRRLRNDFLQNDGKLLQAQ